MIIFSPFEPNTRVDKKHIGIVAILMELVSMAPIEPEFCWTDTLSYKVLTKFSVWKEST